jgi:hypothetical protein
MGFPFPAKRDSSGKVTAVRAFCAIYNGIWLVYIDFMGCHQISKSQADGVNRFSQQLHHPG